MTFPLPQRILGKQSFTVSTKMAQYIIPDPAIVGAGLVREGGRSRAVEALTIVRT